MFFFFCETVLPKVLRSDLGSDQPHRVDVECGVVRKLTVETFSIASDTAVNSINGLSLRAFIG